MSTTEHIYDDSLFWYLVHSINVGAEFFAPVLFVLAYLFLAIKVRSIMSTIGLCGAIFYCLGLITKRFFPDTLAIALGYRIPTVDSNLFVWFFFHYGINIGLLILSITTFYLIFKFRKLMV